MLAQSLAATATLLSFALHGNRIELKLNQGAAELVWVTQSTFRFRHSLDAPLAQMTWADKENVGVRAVETPGDITFESKFLRVSIQRRGLLVKVRKYDGTLLTGDLTEARPRDGGGVEWEISAGQSESFFGLGPRADVNFDLRGKVIRTSNPMLVSSAGYGEYHSAPGSYTFDLAVGKADRFRIQAPSVDYYFFYGPSMKQIFEEAALTRSAVTPIPLAEVRTGSWDTLREQVTRMMHASISAMLLPVFDLTPYENAPSLLAERARQLGQISPGATPEKAVLTDFRRQLLTFFATYAEEARDRGFPFFHPLPFQFPEDPEAVRHADEFLLGDEMLVAPICTPAGSRQVYLPRGIWTNMETDEVTPGRKTIMVRSKSLPLFARNGTIVPLDSIRKGEPMMLHYYPSLGAEFFLLETEIGDWSQVHAAPAADILRLEIESKVDRLYQWVVHHVPRPQRVEFEQRRYAEVKSPSALKDGTWYYDTAARNLQVRVFASAGSDVITNLITPE
jgi:hypothetical protein